jgi:hypothetical protein
VDDVTLDDVIPDDGTTSSATANGPADTSLTTVLGELERAGWAGQFMALEGGSIRCVTCREVFPAQGAEADEVRRLEGVSDPADMLIVVPLTCPNCGTRGALVAHYGADASGEEADVVAALSRNPRHRPRARATPRLHRLSPPPEPADRRADRHTPQIGGLDRGVPGYGPRARTMVSLETNARRHEGDRAAVPVEGSADRSRREHHQRPPPTAKVGSPSVTRARTPVDHRGPSRG